MSFPLISADLVVPNQHARGLRHDFSLLVEIARHPDAKLYGLSQRALKAADDIMNRFQRLSGERERDDMLISCREIAKSVLGDKAEWRKDGKIWAIGHCHIDTAWLWRYTQTQQKVSVA
jgi:alpha-mannosidase